MEEKTAKKKKEKCAIPGFRGLGKCRKGGEYILYTVILLKEKIKILCSRNKIYYH